MEAPPTKRKKNREERIAQLRTIYQRLHNILTECDRYLAANPGEVGGFSISDYRMRDFLQEVLEREDARPVPEIPKDLFRDFAATRYDICPPFPTL